MNSFFFHISHPVQVTSNIETLESYVKEHEAYHSAHLEALDWVRKTRIAVQQCSDCHGEKQDTVDKQWKVNDIANTLPVGKFIPEFILH